MKWGSPALDESSQPLEGGVCAPLSLPPSIPSSYGALHGQCSGLAGLVLARPSRGLSDALGLQDGVQLAESLPAKEPWSWFPGE